MQQPGNAEIPNRDVQREIVFGQMRNPATREMLRSAIPANKEIDYTYRAQVFETGNQLAEIARTEGGNVYKYVLGIATVAQNPEQLANALATLRVLAEWKVGYEHSHH